MNASASELSSLVGIGVTFAGVVGSWVRNEVVRNEDRRRLQNIEKVLAISNGNEPVFMRSALCKSHRERFQHDLDRIEALVIPEGKA